jgi:DnaJ-class molecular chaperone
MTKRKVKNEVPVVAEDLKLGPKSLIVCPACMGYGGVPHGDVWKPCQACGGGGRVVKEEEPDAAPAS